MNKKIRFHNKGQCVYIAFASITFIDAYGKINTTEVALRLDGREKLGYRVDAAKGFPIFEAIDKGNYLPNLRQAKEYAIKWLNAANEQKTLSPKL